MSSLIATGESKTLSPSVVGGGSVMPSVLRLEDC